MSGEEWSYLRSEVHKGFGGWLVCRKRLCPAWLGGWVVVGERNLSQATRSVWSLTARNTSALAEPAIHDPLRQISLDTHTHTCPGRWIPPTAASWLHFQHKQGGSSRGDCSSRIQQRIHYFEPRSRIETHLQGTFLPTPLGL